MKKSRRCRRCRGTGHVQREFIAPEPEERAVFDFLGIDVARMSYWAKCPDCRGTRRESLLPPAAAV